MQYRKLNAGQGWAWLKAGLSLIRRSPLMWLSLALIYCAAVLGPTFLMPGAGLLSVVLSVAAALLNPVFIAGFMAGCRAQEVGEEIELAHLFAGFRERTLPLVAVGGIYLSGLMIVMSVANAIGGDAVKAIAALASQAAGSVDPQAVAGHMQDVFQALLIALALLAPLLMAYWFAPALVMFDGLTPLAAMKTSFFACLANVLPFLVYSLALFAGASLAVALLQMLLPFLFGSAPLTFWMTSLLVSPVIMASTYTGYRDVFAAPASEPAREG